MQYETFISSIADFFFKKDIIEKYQIEIFKFGTSLTISSVISLSIAFIWGILFGCFVEILTFLALFIPLRVFTGGYHAKTLSRCVLSFVIILFALTMTINCLPVELIAPLAIISVIITIASIYRYSPVQHPNAPIKSDDIPRFRRLSLFICITEGVFITALLIFPRSSDVYRSTLIVASFSMIIVSVLIYLAKLTNKKEV